MKKYACFIGCAVLLCSIVVLESCVTTYQSTVFGHEYIPVPLVEPEHDTESQLWLTGGAGGSLPSHVVSQPLLALYGAPAETEWNGLSDLELEAGLTWIGAWRSSESVLWNLSVGASGFWNYTWVDMSGYTYDGYDAGAKLQAECRFTYGKETDLAMFSIISVLGYSFERGDWWDERNRTDEEFIFPDNPDQMSSNISSSGNSLFGTSAIALSYHLDQENVLELSLGFTLDFSDIAEYPQVCLYQTVYGVSFYTGDFMVWMNFAMDADFGSLISCPQDSLNLGVSFRL